MHVSGAAWFYQKKDCDIEKLPPHLQDRKLMGVCLHPKFGGYFSARAVVLTNQPVDRPISPPIKMIEDKETVTKLLTEMNDNWQEGRWREMIPVKERYSRQAAIYFNTPPKSRGKLIQAIKLCGEIKSS